MSFRFVSCRLPSFPLHSLAFFLDAHGAAASRGEFLNLTVYGRRKNRIPRAWRSIQIICQHSGTQTTLLSETWLQGFPQNQSLPPILPKKEKRPYVSPRKKLSKKEKKHLGQLSLSAPKNGMLVEELIPVAHNVMAARSILYEGVKKLMKVLAVHACDFCLQIHVGHRGHHIRSCQVPNSNLRNAHHFWVKANIDDILVPVESFHLFDRLAKLIKHDQRFKIDRLPAVLELCIQAGVDLPEYPTLRRTCPIKRLTKGEDLKEMKTAVMKVHKSLQAMVATSRHLKKTKEHMGHVNLMTTCGKMQKRTIHVE
ncbi:hypothetical protein O6H91_20G076000 [Diphasiastrum complanatum]|uniref:Uncharacterized protein n=1 Tax=Diphasiastrum complanatum TaxID=34168 RepID=A0ACC2ARX1_DIPCM|nr:hypothetical protein O6H91_20G076000 [Diphasiastrum complanatum]